MAARREGESGKGLGMGWEWSALAGGVLQDAGQEFFGADGEIGGPVERGWWGGEGQVGEDIGGEQVVNGGLDAVAEQGHASLGVREALQESGGVVFEIGELSLKEGVNKGGATDGLAAHTKAGDDFGAGVEELEGLAEMGSGGRG